MITAVELRDAPFFATSHYLKVRDRASFEFALVSAAAAMDIKNGKIEAARLALGGVATKPWRAKEAEAALIGAAPDVHSFANAAAAAMKDAKPRKYNGFKVELAKRTIVRALAEVAERYEQRATK